MQGLDWPLAAPSVPHHLPKAPQVLQVCAKQAKEQVRGPWLELLVLFGLAAER